MLVEVRGANGLNMMVHSASPADPNDLSTCRNIDLSVERCIQPRRGLLRMTSWPGLLYDEATGKLYTGLAGITGPITMIYPNPSPFVAPPGVDT